jgi:Tol biopolymer transport system component
MKRAVAGAVVALVVCGIGVPGASARSASPTTRVSVSTGGGQGDLWSSNPSISGDGRFVAFTSEATNLVPGGAGGVFVHDLRSGRTELVSVASDGTIGNGLSWAPSMSGDGRYVAFQSYADNLVPGDSNRAFDVFVRDRRTGRTERVSVADDGAQLTTESMRPSIDGEGRRVAFVTGSSGGDGQILLRDRLAGRTITASVAYDGGPADFVSTTPVLSADGGSVAFMSGASNLVRDDTNQTSDIFVYRVATGRVIRASVGVAGESDLPSFLPAISGDGRHVTFVSQSTNLVPDHPGFVTDLFVRDTVAERTRLVSATPQGVPGNDSAWTSALDHTGRHIAYYTSASNLVPGDTNGAQDVLLFDQETGTTRLVPTTVDGAHPNGASYNPSLDARGRVVAYSSGASNLVAGDTNRHEDVFVTDLRQRDGS